MEKNVRTTKNEGLILRMENTDNRYIQETNIKQQIIISEDHFFFHMKYNLEISLIWNENIIFV